MKNGLGRNVKPIDTVMSRFWFLIFSFVQYLLYLWMSPRHNCFLEAYLSILTFARGCPTACVMPLRGTGGRDETTPL